ncbi:DUF1801 domain-containing protein [Pedobacter sp. Hv1]|uniref:DUF1801 domain-containing protein n=1 Tax=Pedobacter sp. Hv1 TaxID=1740090 RepID=UPI0006D89481|nr:DUF1801 domain-containing protein [Pedobacter sp. Hv1]KQC02333.1 hypothetical protein AQF98_01780 [Pedobacter sp. Hv1]
MAELKTKATEQFVQDYLMQIEDETTRQDCQTICKLMEEVTQASAKMWGPAIVGVGDYKYLYESGRTNDWFMMGFSPRKANISLYILGCDADDKKELLTRFGKHKASKGCIYVKKLADIDINVLKELCIMSYEKLKT